MQVRLITVFIKPQQHETFLGHTKTLTEAIRQSGNPRQFQVIQRDYDPNEFVLVEVYETEDHRQEHLNSEAFLQWRKAVAPTFSKPLVNIQYHPVFMGLEE